MTSISNTYDFPAPLILAWGWFWVTQFLQNELAHFFSNFNLWINEWKLTTVHFSRQQSRRISCPSHSLLWDEREVAHNRHYLSGTIIRFDLEVKMNECKKMREVKQSLGVKQKSQRTHRRVDSDTCSTTFISFFVSDRYVLSTMWLNSA